LLWSKFPESIKEREAIASPKGEQRINVIEAGIPVSAYIVGQGCRRGDGYFELTRTENDRNPQDWVGSPAPLGTRDWTLQLDLRASDQSIWSIRLGDIGQIEFSEKTHSIKILGPLFAGLKSDGVSTLALDDPGARSLNLVRRDGQLTLQISGTKVEVLQLTKDSFDSVGVTADSGTIQIINFRYL
jgi:hypothetical protein